MLDDPDVADWLAAQPEPKGQASPRLSEFDKTTALLTDIYDRLGVVIEAVVVSNGGKPPKIKPLPRPTSGVAKARARREAQQFAALEADFRAAQERWAAARQGESNGGS